ncbi:excalibur calcium-binding domain-containing protein [Kribbella sp. NPDC048915]|uniref:excalibur calcium-binding domain-containing protein n=1 Tax=Kribbella sp. NPDC048915 TaxID=3155148 RepID=UPI0033D09F26
MRQFNAPPGWPDPPTARWRPDKGWRPPESWPPAPRGWAFWVDEAGRPVRGPIGRYGGPSRVKVGAIAGVPLALIALVLANPFGDGNDTAGTVPLFGRTTSPPASAAATPTTAPSGTPGSVTPQRTEASPTANEPTERPTSPTSAPPSKATSAPTQAPTTTRTQPTTARVTTATATAAPATTTAVTFRSCAEARAAGKAPLYRGQPGYSAALDHNGDGVACDRGNS